VAPGFQGIRARSGCVPLTVCPGFRGSLKTIRERFQHPVGKGEDEERRDELKHGLAALILRRTKDGVASELQAGCTVSPGDVRVGLRGCPLGPSRSPQKSEYL
jgi:hypothetical protein